MGILSSSHCTYFDVYSVHVWKKYAAMLWLPCNFMTKTFPEKKQKCIYPSPLLHHKKNNRETKRFAMSCDARTLQTDVTIPIKKTVLEVEVGC